MSNQQQNNKETYIIDKKHMVEIPTFSCFEKTKNVVLVKLYNNYYIYDTIDFISKMRIALDKLKEEKDRDKKNKRMMVIRSLCSSVINNFTCDEDNKIYLGKSYSGEVEYEEVIPNQRVLVKFK